MNARMNEINRKKDSAFSNNDYQKKAQVSHTLILSIIAVMTFVVVLAFLWGPLKELAQQTASEKTCKVSVDARDKAGIIKSGVPLNCETNYYCFKTAGGECPKAQKPYMETFTVINENELKSNAAELMRTCWRQLGEARKNFVSGEFCSICSVLFFDEKLQMSNVDVESYLNTAIMPGENPNKYTYAAYFTLTEEKPERIPVFKADILNTNEIYFITYSATGKVEGLCNDECYALRLIPSSAGEKCSSLESM